MSPRPAMPVGTYGTVWTSDSGAPYKARVRFRDADGVVRTVARFGQTKTAARNALKVALAERKAATGAGITRDTTVSELARVWLAEVDASELPPQTREMYRYRVTSYVTPTIGGLRIREATTSACEAALMSIREKHGPGAAKTAKSILNGMFGLAARHDAVATNPVRDTSRIPRSKSLARALTPAEKDTLTDLLRSDQRAVDLDLPDLVEFMLGTAVRIGEALAVRESVLNLPKATLEINATVVRLKGQGVIIQERAKTDASHRVLPLPSFVVGMIERRLATESLARPQGVIFPSPLGQLRDRSNTAGDLRDVLQRLGCPDCADGWCGKPGPFSWVHSHVFRKTALTRLDEDGMTPREIADFAGHTRPSMSQDVYMGRKQVSRRAAEVLDR